MRDETAKLNLAINAKFSKLFYGNLYLHYNNVIRPAKSLNLLSSCVHGWLMALAAQVRVCDLKFLIDFLFILYACFGLSFSPNFELPCILIN